MAGIQVLLALRALIIFRHFETISFPPFLLDKLLARKRKAIPISLELLDTHGITNGKLKRVGGLSG